MAEVQKTSPVSAGEMAQRFVQFVMMQAQNILYVLGRLPTPEGRSMPPNFEAAKMLIDQLEMIQEKTKNNLSAQETKILENALNNVRLAFVEATGGTPPSMMPSPSYGDFPEDLAEEPASEHPPAPAAAEKKPAPSPVAPASPATPQENKKKFSKTYG